MLLEDVIKKTPDNHIDKVSLKEALKQIEDVAQHIEERLKEYEMSKVMLNIQKSLAGNQPNIIAPGRRLLKQGKLMKVPRAGGTHGQQRYFVLFSDILMYYQKRNNILLKVRFSHHFPLLFSLRRKRNALYTHCPL